MIKPPGAVRLVPHRWKKVRFMPWPVCVGCGLIWLRNEATRRAVRKGHWLYEDEVHGQRGR